MKKIFLAISVVAALISCKNENKKQVVVGTNDEGKELIVNDSGDTIVYEPTSESVETIEENQTKDLAFQKSDDGMYNFSFNLKKGEKYPFNIKTTANNTQSDGKKSLTVNQESITEMEYVVKNITPEGFVMDVTFKRFAEKMSDGKQTIEFDTNSTTPKDNAAKQRWEINKAIVGNSFNMTVNKKGEVQDISNLFKIRNNVKDKLKSNLKEDELTALDGFLNATLSDESMKQIFEESVAYYPKKAVKKGDTWNKEESEGKAKSKVEYTFDGIENGLAIISIKGTSSGSDSQTDPNGSGIKIFRTLKGTVNGTIKIDEKSGWIKSAVMSKDETIAMTQQLNKQKSNFSSKTKSTTKINL